MTTSRMSTKSAEPRIFDTRVELLNRIRHADDDTGKDQQTDPVADPALGNLLANPHDEHRPGHQGQRREQGKSDRLPPPITRPGCRCSQYSDAGSLNQAKDDGQVARILRDLPPPELAFFLDLLQRPDRPMSSS